MKVEILRDLIRRDDRQLKRKLYEYVWKKHVIYEMKRLSRTRVNSVRYVQIRQEQEILQRK